jgi:glycosyltransferase involved in cell wall biosynthesis
MARILVNLLSYTGHKGGMETYARELYREIGTLDTGHEYIALGSKEFMTRDYSWFPGKVIDSGISGENRWTWAFGELFMVSRAARKLGADLIHSPMTLGPWRSKAPAVYTMHDMLYFRSPELMATPFYTLPMQWLEKRAASNATMIITDSVVSSHDIQKYLKFPEDRIVVTPLGATPPQSIIEPAKTRQRDLMLAVGVRLPHKNFEGVVRALARIPESDRPRLVVTGSRNDDPLRPVVDELGLGEWVDLKGWVTNDELDWLYANASALIVSNFVDGYCLPALEAMIMGLPVLMSDIPVYHEVGGDAVGYFDPTDPDSIAAIILKASKEPEWLASLATRARIHVKAYTWNRCAIQTLDVFDRSLSNPTRAMARA